MENNFVRSLQQLFVSAQEHVTESKGKKVWGIFTEMPAHKRLFFKQDGQYASGAVYSFKNGAMRVYVIHYSDDGNALCYHGDWKPGSTYINWFVSDVKGGATEVLQDAEQAPITEELLSEYLVLSNCTASIQENDPRAGYFIPVYP